MKEFNLTLGSRVIQDHHENSKATGVRYGRYSRMLRSHILNLQNEPDSGNWKWYADVNYKTIPPVTYYLQQGIISLIISNDTTNWEVLISLTSDLHARFLLYEADHDTEKL